MMQMVTPLAHRLAQQRQEALVGAGVEAGRRLVQQPQPRARRHDPREAQELALGKGQIDGARMRACPSSPVAASVASTRWRGARPCADAPPGCHSHEPRSVTVATFSSTVMCVNSLRSWNVRPMPSRAIFQCGRPRMDLPSQSTSPRSGARLPGDQVEQRGLAGAVRADQRGDDAGAQRQRHVVDGLQAAEGLGGAGHLQAGSVLLPAWLMASSRAFGFSWKPHRPPGR